MDIVHVVKLDQESQTPKWMEELLPMEGKSRCEFDGFLASRNKAGFTFECHFSVTSNEKCCTIRTTKPKKQKSVATQAKPNTKEASTNIDSKHLTILELRDYQFSGFTGISSCLSLWVLIKGCLRWCMPYHLIISFTLTTFFIYVNV